MIENKLVAILLLILMVAGAVIFTVFRSYWGPVLTLAGIVGYFLFNRRG